MIGSNIHYFYYPLEYCFRKMAELGYTKMELYLGTPHVFVDGIIKESFADIRRLEMTYGIRIIAVHPETISFRYNLCSPDKDWRKRSLEAYLNAIDFAESYGIGRLNTEINGVFRDIPRGETEKRVWESLSQIIHYGNERGVVVALETERRSFQGLLSTVGEFAHMTEQLPEPPAITLNCDAAAEAGETVDDWFERFGEGISMIRFGDSSCFRELRPLVEANGYCGDYIFYPTDDKYWDEPVEADRMLIGGAGWV